MGTEKGRGSVRRWLTPLAAALAALMGGRIAIADPAPASRPGPLTIKDFLAPADLLTPRLSPSGKVIAMVRRVNDIDQVIRVDLPDFKVKVLYQTKALPPALVEKTSRESVTYLDWKSDQALVVSLDTPVRARAGDNRFTMTAPVHMILDPAGGTPPILLNAKMYGKVESVELSWMQSLLKGDPGHVMIGVRKGFDEVQLYRVNIADGDRTLLETGGWEVVGYGTDRAGAIVTRTLEHADGTLTLQGVEPGLRGQAERDDHLPIG